MGKLNRKLVQFLVAVGTNGYFKGFVEGKIYRGASKSFCVPGLNCYSCPGALGSCPIGSLQAVIADVRYKFSFYVTGFLILVGISLGRFVCGWLCPFGLFQELIYKVPFPKIKVGKRFEFLRYAKYLVLIIFVIILPMFWVNDVGLGQPTFCKFICPAGTLEGGIPLVSMNSTLRAATGFLFHWKLALLIFTIVFSFILFRPFCRFVCPLGAIYALFNPISIYRLEVDFRKCNDCGACLRKCKLGIEVYQKPNHPECIRCGECLDVCPTKALVSRFGIK